MDISNSTENTQSTIVEPGLELQIFTCQILISSKNMAHILLVA